MYLLIIFRVWYRIGIVGVKISATLVTGFRVLSPLRDFVSILLYTEIHVMARSRRPRVFYEQFHTTFCTSSASPTNLH